MNVLYDINDLTLYNDLSSHLSNSKLSFQEISYSTIKQPVIILKEIQTKQDLISLSKQRIPHHSLVPIINQSEMMFHLLDYYPLCFIRKNHLKEDIEKCIVLLNEIYHQAEKLITFKIRYSYIQLKCSNISYIESYGHYLLVHTNNNEYRVREKLSTTLRNLSSNFIQVHKSYIINKKYIKQINSNEIVLLSGMSIPIGKTYRNQIQNKI